MRQDICDLLETFVRQASFGGLQTKGYPKRIGEFEVKTSFGKGKPAQVPWVAFLLGNNAIRNGIYPAYLYYKNEGFLILSYCVSETRSAALTWPKEIIAKSKRISLFFDDTQKKYGDSIIFRVYKPVFLANKLVFYNGTTKKVISRGLIELDFSEVLNFYSKLLTQ